MIPAFQLTKKIAAEARLKVALAGVAVLMFAGVSVAQPKISLSPTGGPPTTTVRVSGSGFTPNARINIYFDTKDEALAVANGSGSFSKISIVVPAKAIPGTHWISAVQRVGKLGAKAAFWVHTNWSQSGFTPNEDNFNPYENVLNPRTVGGLTLDWNYPDISASAVAGGSFH